MDLFSKEVTTLLLSKEVPHRQDFLRKETISGIAATRSEGI